MKLNLKITSVPRLILAAVLAVVLQACSQSYTQSGGGDARPDFVAPYTSDPFSMLQRYGPPKLTPKAQEYWDNFTPDMDPAIQCLASTLARNMYSPSGILVDYLENGDVKLSTETVYMDGRDFPAEYAMDKRGSWPVSEEGYSIGYWEGDSLFVETRGIIERDILMGHIPIMPSEMLLMKRQFKLIPHDQRWEARGLAPQEGNYFLVSEEDGGKTLEMDIWMDDPVNLEEVWHTVKHYREVSDASTVTTSDDMPVVATNAPTWEGTDAAKNSGVPAEFLESYDGGCVLFPEYDLDGDGTVSDFVPE